MPTIDMTFTPMEVAAQDQSEAELNAMLDSLGASGSTSGANTGTGAGKTPASSATPWLRLAGETIQVTGTVLAAAINGANETERERIRAAAQERQGRIALELRQAIINDPSRAAELRLQVVALQQTIDAIQPKSNTLLYVAIGGVALLAVGAIAYVALSGRNSGRRKNPVFRTRSGKRGKRFLPMAEYRELKASSRSRSRSRSRSKKR